MPVILYVRVSTPHPHPKPTLTRWWDYHHPDYQRLLRRSRCAEHGDYTPASGSLTGGYGRGGWSVCRRAKAPRPSSADQYQGTCHGHFAWAADGGGLPRQSALDAGVLTPHQPHAHPHSGRFQLGDHRLSADSVHRHRRHLRPLAEALTRRSSQQVGAQPPHEDTRVNPVGLRKDARREPHCHRLPDPDWLQRGIRRVHLDSPTLDCRRPGAQRVKSAAVGMVSPDQLARHAAPPWRWLEAVEPPPTLRHWLPDPDGDTPPGQRLTPRHGRRAASARAQRLERTHQRRLAAGRGGGRAVATSWPSSADRHRRPTTTRALRFWQEETR